VDGLDGASLWTLVGGIGLFLLGMSLMTDGLTATGTRALRALMAKVTRSRTKALLTGAGVTAIVQSSSATTLLTVSFVSAGLVSFHQSIAILLGANIGTTSTAWIVSLVGFKVDSAAFALPAIGIGSLLRLISHGRRAALGMAIAGFGLIFLGIDFLQEGMKGVAAGMRPEDLATDGILGTLILFGIGVVMTVIMQSSSAAAATTLAAVHAGSLSFEQAAALIIGQNVGTTSTALLGAIGGTLSAKRAAAAHTMFNASAGFIALILLTPFTKMVHTIGDAWLGATPEVMVALFQTCFKVIGVALLLPIIEPFARLIERIVPERGDAPTRRLVPAALEAPAMALEAARRTAMELGVMTIEAVDGALESAARPRVVPPSLLGRAARLVREPKRLLTGDDAAVAALEARLSKAAAGLEALRVYLGRIRVAPDSDVYREHLAVVYARDHIQRLEHAARDRAMVEALSLDPQAALVVEALRDEIYPVVRGLAARSKTEPNGDPEALDDAALQRAVDALREGAAARRLSYRASLLARMAEGGLSAADVDELLDMNRWLADIGHGVARTVEFLTWPERAGLTLASGEAPTRPSRAARSTAAAEAARDREPRS